MQRRNSENAYSSISKRHAFEGLTVLLLIMHEGTNNNEQE